MDNVLTDQGVIPYKILLQFDIIVTFMQEKNEVLSGKPKRLMFSTICLLPRPKTSVTCFVFVIKVLFKLMHFAFGFTKCLSMNAHVYIDKTHKAHVYFLDLFIDFFHHTPRRLMAIFKSN